MKKQLFLLAAAIGLATTQHSHSALVIDMVESGSDVVATLSGSIDDLTGATPNQTPAGSFSYNYVRGNDATFSFTNEANGTSLSYNNYDITTKPSNFGSGSSAEITPNSTASTSLMVRTFNPAIWVPVSYTLGTPITGALTWTGADFTTLGVTEGTYVWSWTGDSVTLNIGGAGPGPAPVPEPGQVAASLLLLGGIATHLAIKRRKAKRPATA